jgi:outer membrane protein assembly factor BamB
VDAARRRAITLALIGACALGGGFAWLTLGFVPLRDAVGGPFAGHSLTPARAYALSRKKQPDASWPMFGASPARARFVASDLRPPFRLAFSIPGESLIEMPPAVSQGRVVFGTHDGVVIAARARDGIRLWSTDIRGCIASSPAVRAGIVYIGWSGVAPCGRPKDGRGGIVALGLATGRLLWHFNAGNVEASPAVVDARLFFSGFRTRRDSRVYSMRLGEGRRIVWSFHLPTKVASSPALLGRKLFISAYDRRLYSFDGWTGRLRWHTTAFSDDPEVRMLLGLRSLVRRRSWSEGGYYATPAVTYDRAYLGVIDGVFSAFDAHTGAHRWSRRLAGSIYGSAAVWKETVYVGTTGGVFYALSARNGRTRWQQRLGGKILGSPTVTNGRVYISTTNRETFVLDARTGALDWRFADGYYSPLVVAGSRGFLVGKGRLYALDNAPRVRSAFRVPNAQ